MFNLDQELNERERRRLRDELVVWLTTVSPNGVPMPTPVWYWWDGETFILYSEPDQAKLRNIARNPIVTLNLNSDRWGGDVIIVTGEAKIDETAPQALDNPPYLEKYRQGISDIQMTPESFSRSFNQRVRVRPLKVRKW